MRKQTDEHGCKKSKPKKSKKSAVMNHGVTSTIKTGLGIKNKTVTLNAREIYKSKSSFSKAN